MDGSRRLGRRRAPPHLPRPGLVVSGREERDQVERAVARRDHPLESRFAHAELLEERPGFLGLHLGGLGFDRRVDADRLAELGGQFLALLEVRDHDLRLERQRSDRPEVPELFVESPASRSGRSASSASFARCRASTSGPGLPFARFSRLLDGALHDGEVGQQQLAPDVVELLPPASDRRRSSARRPPARPPRGASRVPARSTRRPGRRRSEPVPAPSSSNAPSP